MDKTEKKVNMAQLYAPFSPFYPSKMRLRIIFGFHQRNCGSTWTCMRAKHSTETIDGRFSTVDLFNRRFELLTNLVIRLGNTYRLNLAHFGGQLRYAGIGFAARAWSLDRRNFALFDLDNRFKTEHISQQRTGPTDAPSAPHEFQRVQHCQDMGA